MSEIFVSTLIYQTLLRKIRARLGQNDQNFIILTHTLALKSTDILSFLETKKAIFKNQIIHNYIIIVMFHRHIFSYPLT